MGKLLIVADLQKKCFATPRGLELAYKLGLSTEVVAFTYTCLLYTSPSPRDKF